jgi:two-component system sensor histidine kinase KdpD
MIRVNRRLVSALASILGTLAAALICCFVFHVSQTVAALILMLCVLGVGAYGNRLDALLTPMMAALCLDFLFIPPLYRITIADLNGWISFLVFLATSVIATNLSSRLRRQRDELIARQIESERLHALSRALLLNNRSEDMRRLLLNKCLEIFSFEEAALFEIDSGEFWRTHADGKISIDDLRRAATIGSIEHAAHGVTVIPVALGNKTFGSLGYRGPNLPAPSLQSLGNTLATGIAQAQAHEAGSRAEAVRRSEELKSVMIDAMAHDLKTPLTAIEIAAETLSQAPGVSVEQTADLLQVIRQETRGLRRLVDAAIHLSRIDAKRLRLESQPLQIEDVVNSAILSVGERAASHTLRVECQPGLPPVAADNELLVQALKQLIDNALKYSPARSVITVAATEMDGLVSLSVRDQGQGLTEMEQRRVFDKFYRGTHGTEGIQGTGMGLSIAKEIAEAHGGSVRVESQVGKGSRFTITLQAAAGVEA